MLGRQFTFAVLDARRYSTTKFYPCQISDSFRFTTRPFLTHRLVLFLPYLNLTGSCFPPGTGREFIINGLTCQMLKSVRLNGLNLNTIYCTEQPIGFQHLV